jgi:CHASE3 domain sensor protein
MANPGFPKERAGLKADLVRFMPMISGKLWNHLRHGHLREAGIQILAAAVGLLIASILLLAMNISHLRESFAQDERTDQAILLIDQVEARLLGVEMTVRGFALTDDAAFLQRGDRDRKSLQTAVTKLAAIMADEPTQKSRFAAMHALVRQRLDLYAYLATDEHAREVARAITDPQTRKVMSNAREKLKELREAEIALLGQRQAAMIAEARHTFYLAVGIVVLAFVAGALGLFLSQCGQQQL